MIFKTILALIQLAITFIQIVLYNTKKCNIIFNWFAYIVGAISIVLWTLAPNHYTLAGYFWMYLCIACEILSVHLGFRGVGRQRIAAKIDNEENL